MKFIARHLNLIGLLLLTAFGAAAAGLYFQTPDYKPAVQAKVAAPAAFVCPMHPNVTSATQSDCPECGMKLVAIGSEKTEAATAAHESGCCAKKPVAVEPSPAAMACPHLAAQAAQAAQTPPADACCSKSANP